MRNLMRKSEYLRPRLEDMRNKVEFSGLRKQIQDRMYQKMSQHELSIKFLNFRMYKLMKEFRILALQINISIEDSKQLIRDPDYYSSLLPERISI
jgi:hypothetical protein